MAATVIAKGAPSSTVLTSQAQFHLVFSSLSMAAVQVSVIVALSSKVIDQDQPRPTIGGEVVGDSGFHPKSSCRLQDLQDLLVFGMYCMDLNITLRQCLICFMSEDQL